MSVFFYDDGFIELSSEGMKNSLCRKNKSVSTISVMSFVDVTDFMQSGKRRDGRPFHGRHAHTTPWIPIGAGHRSLIAITFQKENNKKTNQIKIQISRAYNNNNNKSFLVFLCVYT